MKETSQLDHTGHNKARCPAPKTIELVHSPGELCFFFNLKLEKLNPTPHTLNPEHGHATKSYALNPTPCRFLHSYLS